MHQPFARFLAITLVSLAGVTHAAQENTYPTKPIKIVVPFAPGGGTDTVGRLLAKQITERTGQSVVVENRTGAGGSIGANAVAKAAPDGHTLLLTVTGPVTIIPNLNTQVGYKTSDLAPVAIAYRSPFMVTVEANSPYQTLDELLRQGSKPETAPAYGSSGTGSLSHLTSELINQLADTRFRHVPYKGSQDTLYGLVRGDVQWGLQSVADSRNFLSAERIKPLAVLSKQRSPIIPDVPTLDELGIKGIDLDLWFGFFAPADTPKDTVSAINRLIVEILSEPSVAQQLRELGGQGPIKDNTPEHMKATIDNEVESFTAIAKAIDLKLD